MQALPQRYASVMILWRAWWPKNMAGYFQGCSWSSGRWVKSAGNSRQRGQEGSGENKRPLRWSHSFGWKYPGYGWRSADGEGDTAIARSYILYREEHKDLRQAKKIYGIKDDLKLPLNSLFVLKNRYLLKNDAQQVIETPRELFQRVAKAISQGELNYKSPYRREEVEATFLQMMTSLKFMPNSPTLMNAGTELGSSLPALSCRLKIPLGAFWDPEKHGPHSPDGRRNRFWFLSYQTRGDIVSTTKGEASGPISFMSIFNQATGIIVQGGRRRGANMGILRCDHPDIVDFIQAKHQDGRSLISTCRSVLPMHSWKRSARMAPMI